jgi:hypothetical protein
MAENRLFFISYPVNPVHPVNKALQVFLRKGFSLLEEGFRQDLQDDQDLSPCRRSGEKLIHAFGKEAFILSGA